MNLSLTSLLPTLFWTAIAIGGIAVGLGRQAPRALPTQNAAVPRYQSVNGRVFANQDFQPRFIDRETGRLFQVDFHVPRDRAIFHPTEDWHGWLAYGLFGLAGLHALAALWHHFILKDGVLRRMIPGLPRMRKAQA